MHVSNAFQFWQQRKPPSYVGNKPIEAELRHFDMGECLLVRRSVAYPDPAQIKLKGALAAHFGVVETMVSLGTGSDELIERIPRIFLNPGGHALVVVPGFFRFIDATLRVSATPVLVKTHIEDHFQITERIAHEIIDTAKKKSVRLIWLCSPNNPTGLAIPNHIRDMIIQGIPDALIVLDQVFLSILEKDRISNFLAQHKNVIILRSFSKIDGLAGARVGFTLARPAITELVEAWRLPFNIPQASLTLTLKQLQNVRSLQSAQRLLAKERKRVLDHIHQLSDLEIGAPSTTNVFLLRHKSIDLFESLLSQGIIVADLRSAPGLEGMGFVRITIKSPGENTILLKDLTKIARSMI